MPYKIPVVAHSHQIGTVPDLRGFCVYLPDDPQFIANFVGAYTFFTKWLAYERDDEKTGKKAADMMWAAYEKTMESFYGSGCGDEMAFDCETMKDCLIEVAEAFKLNVTVNNYVSGGGDSTLYCVDDGGNITVNPPPIGNLPVQPTIPPPVDDITPIDDGSQPGEGEPPEGWATWEEYDADACQAANSMVEYAYQWAIRSSDFLTEDVYTIASILVVIVNILTLGWGVLFERALLLKIAEVVANMQLWGQPIGFAFQEVADYIEANRQEMVCELYQARTSASNWSNLLIARLFGASADTFEDISGRSTWQELLGYMFPQNLAANALYRVFTWKGATTNFVDCSVCVQNDAVWTFVQTGDTQGIAEGWNLYDRLSFVAQNERNSTFSSGYTQAKLDLDPTILNPSTLTVNVIVDSRSEGMETPVLSLASGVGIDEGSYTLSMGVNVIPITGNINRINVRSVASRFVAGVQTWQFDATFDYTLAGV